MIDDREQRVLSGWTPERFSALFRGTAALLIGGVVLGIFAATVNVYYVCAVIGACILAMVVAWQFEAALIVFILVAFVAWGRTPDIAVGLSGQGRGVYASELMLGFLLAIWLGYYILRALPERRIPSGFYVPAALYLGYCVLSTVNGFVFWDPHVDPRHQHIAVNLIEIALRLLSVAALVMMATTFKTRRWLMWASIAVFVPTSYNLVRGFLPLPPSLTVYGGPLLALFPVCIASVVLFDRSRPGLIRTLCGLVVALGIFVAFRRQISWVSGWLGLFAALGTITFLMNKRVFAVAAVLLCGAVAFSVTQKGWLYEEVIVESQRSGDYERISLMRGAWRYAVNFPLGVGPGNYRSYNSFYYGELWGTTSYTSAHGQYSQCLAETGIPGLVLFLALLAGGLRWMLKSAREVADRFSRTFLLAASGHLVGMAVASTIGDYIIPTFHNGGVEAFSWTVYSWITWGLAIAHVRLANVELTDKPDSAAAAAEDICDHN